MVCRPGKVNFAGQEAAACLSDSPLSFGQSSGQDSPHPPVVVIISGGMSTGMSRTRFADFIGIITVAIKINVTIR